MLGPRVKKVTINGVKIDTLALSTAESRYEQEQSICIEEEKEGLSVTDDGERLPEQFRGKSHTLWDGPFPMWLIFLASLLFSTTMITKFITDVSTKFNPFSKRGKTCRIFLAHLPPSARQTMKINTKLLPRTSREGSSLSLKFSKSNRSSKFRLAGSLPVNEDTDMYINRRWQRDAAEY